MKRVGATRDLGPIDWWNVLTHSTMFDVAWNAASRKDPWAQCAVFGRTKGAFQTMVVLPLRYEGGALEIDLEITNLSPTPAIVPAFKWFEEVQNLGDEDEPLMMGFILVQLGPILGTGARVLGPGESFVQEITLRTAAAPHPVRISGRLGPLPPFGCCVCPEAWENDISIDPHKTRWPDWELHEEWADISAEGFRRRL